MIIPLNKVSERVQIAKQSDEATLFMNLMYAGEHLLKLLTLAFLAGINENKGSTKHDKYSLSYDLVHSDSIGIWAQTLDNIISGPAHHYIDKEFQPYLIELTEKVSNPSWQYGALFSLNLCIKSLNSNSDDLPTKSQLKNWFSMFVKLRNDARAHGVLNAEQISIIGRNLETSINLIIDNLSIFKFPWLFAKFQISGSLRITFLNNTGVNQPKREEIEGEIFSDGVYLYINKPFRIVLIESTVDATDFHFPNGNFSDKNYETLSYITGTKFFVSSEKYLRPPGQLPASETEGLGELDLIHNTFTNLPIIQGIYISRRELEDELKKVLLMEDRYPIITLSGRGGIGKTTLALHVLQSICDTARYTAIVWLSARDIDLFDDGPKQVKPQILTEADISKEFTKLIAPKNLEVKGFDFQNFFENELRLSTSDCSNGPILFVMDNFETLRNPKQVYTWLDTHIRNPNKVLITSRLRDFKADYPINVEGMSRDEFNELVERVSNKLKIQDILNLDYLDELFKESDGHPFVVKVMLGEISKQGILRKVKRIIAGKDEILTALFQRTYSDLSPNSKRLFLTLAGWRNIFPEIALDAILNRDENELVDVDDAISELFRYSFIEIQNSSSDNSSFISVPLAAFEFGRKILRVSPLKALIQLDLDLLHYFGVTQFLDINRGLGPRVDYFFKNLALLGNVDRDKFKKLVPVGEYICRKFPDGWLDFHTIYFEKADYISAIGCLQNFLADYRPLPKQKIIAWRKLSHLYLINNDKVGALQSLKEICLNNEATMNDLGNSLQEILNMIAGNERLIEKEEIKYIIKELIDKVFPIIEKRGGINELTRLGRICSDFGSRDKAKILVNLALKRDEENFHALALAGKIRRK